MYQYWGTPSGMTKLYNYNYDKLNRLLYGVLELTPSGTITNSEQGISYDQMGNITALVRDVGSTPIDNLAYTYTGNQLQSVYDNTGNNSGLVAGTTNYTWDGNGNMLTDTNSVNTGQNKTVTYNLLNLPQLVKVHTGTVTYTYDALGNKLRKVSDLSGVTHTTDYIAGIEYDGATTDTLNFIQTEEGKAAKFGSIYDYTYYLGDNLGNTRITFGTRTGSTVTYQSDDYYPFGYEINNSLTGTKNEYLYNKKELQEETQEYDYGARFYDPVIGRTTTIDPLAETSRRWTTYNYGMDNPIRYIDPDGMHSKDSIAMYENQQNADKSAWGAIMGSANGQSLGGNDREPDQFSSGAATVADTAQRKAAVAKSQEYVDKKKPGNQYLKGAKGNPGEKTDCSGLAAGCVVAGGEKDPNHGNQASGVLNIEGNTTKINNVDDVQPGNLVTFRDIKPGAYPYHVGIVIENIKGSDGHSITITYNQSSGGVGPNTASFSVAAGGPSRFVRVYGYYKWDTRPDVHTLTAGGAGVPSPQLSQQTVQ